MREIKFRAWDKIANKMRDVLVMDWYYDYVTNEKKLGFVDYWDFENKEFKRLYPFYVEGSLDTKRKETTFELMQYTGLKDKNGKEIYEGDILALIEPEVKDKQSEFGRMLVKFGEYNTYEIESGDESIGWFMEGYHGYLREDGRKNIYKTDAFDEHPWSLLSCRQWEVIGNIYENPELLKGEK